jgi:DNA-binding transcriptional ArsR family regulator
MPHPAPALDPRHAQNRCKALLQPILANSVCNMPTQRRVKHLDGGSLRALAHPLRVRILGSLRDEGPATATVLGERLGESSGATSYHLRVLAANGFVEEDAARGTARERWWQASHEMTSWRSERFRDDPDERAAEQWLSGYGARRAMEWIDDWQVRRPAADPAWQDAAEQNDYGLDMTAPQVQALVAEVHQVVLRHMDAASRAFASGEADPADARFVRLLVHALPQDTQR